MAAAAIPRQEEIPLLEGEKPKSGLGFFRYTGHFLKNLVKDNKFWARMGAVANGLNFILQGVVGAMFLLAMPVAAHIAHFVSISAAATAGLVALPLAAQVAGLAGCAVLGAVGLSAISLGFPGAWNRLEDICAKTFPKFNPPRSLRRALFRARLKENVQHVTQPPPRKGILKRILPKEHHQDIFLSGVTLEGATVAGVGLTTLALIPAVMAIPTLTFGGAVFLAWSTWSVGGCLFDIYNSTKTLAQTYGSHRQEKKAAKAQTKKAKKTKTAAPPPQAAKSKPLPPATETFNDKAKPDAQKETPPAAPAPRRMNGPPQ